MDDDERLTELGRFLKDRRGRRSPADVGLPAGPRRRVRGLRREEVAALAGIGVSWYTALENGDARGVSSTTLHAVADALALSESEREYALDLIERSEFPEPSQAPDPLVAVVLGSIVFPAYIITAQWDIVDCNEPFRRIWAIDAGELPFNAVERLFLDPAARRMHGANFATNIRPVIAMLRSAHGRRPYWNALRQLRDLLVADETIAAIWNDYEIASPVLSNTCTIDSPIGRLSYETVTLPIPGTNSGIVVQVPDAACREHLTNVIVAADSLR